MSHNSGYRARESPVRPRVDGMLWRRCAFCIVGWSGPAMFAGAVAGIPDRASDLPGFDFTKPSVAAEWLATHDVADVASSPQGLAISLAGVDPYVTGPARDFPGDTPLRMTLVVRPSADGVLQVFYFRDHAREEASVTVLVRGGVWNTVQALLPPLGAGTRLRLDPPGQAGTALIERIGFAPAVTLPAAVWPAHEVVAAAGLRLESGPAAVAVSDRGFALSLNGTRIAASHFEPRIGYVMEEQVQWIEANPPAEVRSIPAGERPAAIETRQTLRDADGGTWQIRRRFTVGSLPGLIDLETAVDVDRDRAVAFLPLMLLVAHEGTTGKQQAVFPGLEYLADEPSSSEADLVGPQARRQVPASHKITFPLMAVADEGRVAGLIWEHRPDLAAVFDSPDRILGSGGHLLGVIAPGSDGLNRIEGELMPLEPAALKAGKSLTLRCSLFGGGGSTIAPAVQAFVTSRGLPEVPKGDGFESYVRQATAGWLDSGIRVKGRFRHAIGPTFSPQPAADAAVFLRWLAGQAGDSAARGRLEEAVAEAIAAVPAGSLDGAAIGHVRMPVQSLLFGRIEETAAAHAAIARRLLAKVRPDGTVAYRPGQVDYGRTHDADHANGLSARVVADALESARFAGDEPLIAAAVGALRSLGQTYAGSVPRGAQTWEVPLHTPDILAAAHLVRAFTIGYELTADRRLLDEAVAWAWTGLPFLYLNDPVGTADGPYGCVTVFGATAWKRPIWIGRPVQWCGLVYAHAIYRLAEHDLAGPWRQLADGITAAGIRYSWPVAPPEASADANARQGLLPDGWEVVEQHRLDPPINPGTLQACAVELFRQGPLFDSRVLPFGVGGVIVHAPGGIEPVAASEPTALEPATPTADGPAAVRFRVTGWPQSRHAVSVTGLAAEPAVMLDGEPLPLTPPHRFDPASGRLTLWLDAPATIGLRGEPRGRSLDDAAVCP